jgi:hypothetical protein
LLYSGAGLVAAGLRFFVWALFDDPSGEVVAAFDGAAGSIVIRF